MTTRIPPLTAACLMILGGINVWLLSILIVDSAPGDHIATSTVVSAPKLQVPADTLSPAKPIDAYNQILAQPIFLRTRAPFVAPPPPAPPAPVAPPIAQTDPGLVLGGIMMSGNIRKAYISSRADPQGTWVGEGEIFMGWKVQSIDSTSTKLRQQSRTIELHLYPPH